MQSKTPLEKKSPKMTSKGRMTYKTSSERKYTIFKGCSANNRSIGVIYTVDF